MRHMRLQVENELFGYYKIIIIIIVKQIQCAVHVKKQASRHHSK